MKGGAYRIVHPLSKGGMGVIYLAVQPLAGVERQCVIKEMLDYFDASNSAEVAKAKQRFQAEAATLTILSHPGIPTIYDYFSEGDHNYIVMEYVEGKDLEERLTHVDDYGNLIPGQLYAEKDVARWGVQVCKILEYLAQIQPNPVIHHDIKPANLVLDKNIGDVRLVDFGTAKARLIAQASGKVGLQKSSVYGTAGYAPPEQYQGRSTPKSDVYSLAATMYHLLTDDDPGNHPFSFPHLSLISQQLASILRRALEQDIPKRSNATQLRQALEKWLQTPLRKKAKPSTGNYRVVLPVVPESAVNSTTQTLVKVLRVSEQQATAWAFAAPEVVLKTNSRVQASQVTAQLKAAGVAARIIEVDERWLPALSAAERTGLLAKGTVPNLHMSRLRPDKRCHCYVCGHQWTSRKAAGGPPPAICPKCKAKNWNRFRLFKCRVCDHEFAHGDQRRPPQQIFPACPACGATEWLPSQQPVLKLKAQKLNLGTVRLGQPKSTVINITNIGKGNLQGVIRCREAWLQIERPFAGSGKVTIPIDTRPLQGEKHYQGVIDVISNGGTAEVQIEFSAQTPEKVVVSPIKLDFGTVGAQPPPPQIVQVNNTGGGTLKGKSTADVPWLELSSTQIQGNAMRLSVSVKPAEMPAGQALTGSIQLDTNGGSVTVPIQVNALSTVLVIIPATLDFGAVPLREKRRLAVHVVNSGAGQLKGQVTSAPDWLRFENTRWSGNSLDLVAEVNGQHLADGVGRTGTIHVSSNGGEADVTVRAVALGPTLAVEPASLDFGAWPAGWRARQRLQLTNLGLGRLNGTIHTTAPWLHLKRDRFSGRAARLDVALRTKGLSPGHYAAVIEINSNGGQALVDVRVQVSNQSKLALRWKRLQKKAWVGGCLALCFFCLLGLAVGLVWPAPVVESTATPVAQTIPTPTMFKVEPTFSAIAIESPPMLPSPAHTTKPTEKPTRHPSQTSTRRPTQIPTRRPTWTPTSLPLCPSPQVRITSPLDGATLQGTVPIWGSANVDGFAFYKFEWRAENTQTWSFLTRFEQPVNDGLLMNWDTTSVSPGTHRLRLVAVDETGNYPDPCEIRITIKR